MNKSYIAAAVAAVALAAGAVWYATAPAPGTTTASFALQAKAEKPADPVPAMVMGQTDAPVTLVEYASFTCPHCKAFHDDVLPQLKKDWIDTGKVKFEFREFYLNQFDLAAATITQCGGPMRYFGIVDILYNEQDKWPAGGDPKQAAQNLLNIAKRAGMTDEQARACMTNEELRNRLVATFQWHATTDEVTGTPTLFIDGTRQANAPYPELAKALEDAYAKIEAAK